MTLARCILFGFLSLFAGAGWNAAGAERPNILFVFTDDQASWALGASGNAEAHTPNLDRLTAEGARFTNAFSVTPVCSPSRVELMTSRYGTEMGILDFLAAPDHSKIAYDPEAGIPAEAPTFPEVLTAAGYYTGLVGKWHLGQVDRFHPTKHGYAWFAGFREGGTVVKDPVLEIEGKQTPFKGLTVDVLTDQAISFLKERPADRPFLLSVHYRSPHGPWKPVAPEDEAPYDAAMMTLPHPDYPNLDVKSVKKKMADYLASVSGVDRNVGRLMETLDALGLRENTVVIFSSDHGYNMGHNGIHHKGNGIWATKPLPPALPDIEQRMRPNLYDQSMRVPLIVRWPGVVAPGSEIAETVTNLDWFPTLVAMAGAGEKVPDGAFIRGRDFTPLLKGESIDGWDNDLYGEYSMINYGIADMRCVRTPEWKLVVDFHNRDRDELYDLKNDPDETTNLIASEDAAVVKVKAELLERLMKAKAAVAKGEAL